jgi:hypothetical protein
MIVTDFIEAAVRPGLALLPSNMDTPAARAMLIAIALQETKLLHRRQIRGPARGFYQFELNGIKGVLEHRATGALAKSLAERLRYPPDVRVIYEALEHNDVLATAFARLLLWTVADPLPGRMQDAEGWRQYLWAWRPGKPHEHTWAGHYEEAWRFV